MSDRIAKQRDARKSDPQRFRAYSRKYYSKNRDAIIARRKAWAKAHPEKIKARYPKRNARRREKYKLDGSEERARVRAWSKANPNKVRSMQRRWRRNNRDRVNAQKRARYAANSDNGGPLYVGTI